MSKCTESKLRHRFWKQQHAEDTFPPLPASSFQKIFRKPSQTLKRQREKAAALWDGLTGRLHRDLSKFHPCLRMSPTGTRTCALHWNTARSTPDAEICHECLLSFIAQQFRDFGSFGRVPNWPFLAFATLTWDLKGLFNSARRSGHDAWAAVWHDMPEVVLQTRLGF